VQDSEEYGYSVTLEEGYDEAVTRSRLALRAEGFSIITEAHVGDVLDSGAGHGRQYLIMSAWAAPVEDRALGSDLQVAVHLPCNFVVQEMGTAALVAALDPAEGSEAQARAATEAREALGRVFARIVAQP
jgi:uncharacterized protein (DUF302 family)